MFASCVTSMCKYYSFIRRKNGYTIICELCFKKEERMGNRATQATIKQSARANNKVTRQQKGEKSITVIGKLSMCLLSPPLSFTFLKSFKKFPKISLHHALTFERLHISSRRSNIRKQTTKIAMAGGNRSSTIDGAESGGGSVAMESKEIPQPQPVAVLSANAPPPFLSKTYDMVDDPATDPIVSWSSNNNSFVVSLYHGEWLVAYFYSFILLFDIW